MEMEDFDDILRILRLGKWNLLYYLACGICGFMIPCFVLAGGFIAPAMVFDCDTTNVTDIIISQSECSYTILSNTSNGISREENSCSKWIYNTTYFDKTMTNEFDLVCDKSYLRPVYQTTYNVGNSIGAPLIGFLADRLGRKAILKYTFVISIASVLLSTVTTHFTVLLGFRFVMGLTSYSLLMTEYILALEICEPKHRTFVGILMSVPWAVGMMWWGALGFLIKDWRWLMGASTLPGVIYVALLCYRDESPRWLIVNGCHRKALKVLKKAGRWNNSTLPPDDELLKRMIYIQKSSENEGESRQSVKTLELSTKIKEVLKRIVMLYRTPEIRKRTLLMYIVFLVSSTVYYGLSLNGVNFQLNPFMYMVVGGLTEIPAYVLSVPIVSKLGRIPPTSFCYFTCGVTILTLGFIPSDPKWLIITLIMAGKFCISSAYQIIYLVATEIFPTQVRMQAIGTSAFVATIGSISSPFITELVGTKYPWVPSIIFGGLSLLAGVSSIFIPETRNKHLPDMVDELEGEAKRQKNRSNEKEAQPFQMT